MQHVEQKIRNEAAWSGSTSGLNFHVLSTYKL